MVYTSYFLVEVSFYIYTTVYQHVAQECIHAVGQYFKMFDILNKQNQFSAWSGCTLQVHGLHKPFAIYMYVLLLEQLFRVVDRLVL